jgi:hypothetical protein
MNCPRCRALIVAEDVNLEHLLAKCRACQEVFRFSPSEIEAVTEHARKDSAISEQPLAPEAPAEGEADGAERDLDIRVSAIRAPRPASIEIEDWGHNRRMVKRWFNYSYIGMAFFCVFWDGFLIFWYSAAFFGDGPLIMILFPILHVGAGAVITYSTIAGFFNSTVVTVDQDTLEVRHGPLPWFGNLTLAVASIEQLYCTEAARNWNNRNNYYARPLVAVNAVLANGTTRVVLNSLPREEGLFIEQQLEEWLKIVPRRVPGQVD